MGTGFPWAPPYTLTPGQPAPGITYPPASPHRLPPRSGSDRSTPKDGHPLSNRDSAWARTRWYWNINQLCIDYAFRPRLSSRLTLGGLAFPRNPWAFGGGVSHPSFAASALGLSPVTLSAQDHSTSELLRTLSRVAASKPTSWLSVQSHIVYHLVQN
jgi:hypothetical protein